MNTQDILGYNVFAGGKAKYRFLIREILQNSNYSCIFMACLNPHSYAEALRDNNFSSALKSADWLIPDGVGIVIAAKVLGRAIKERVTGADVFESVMQELNMCSGSVFFLGSTEWTLKHIEKRLKVDFPNVRIAGLYSPPFQAEFDEVENQAMVAAISAATPDVLWVGMTAPKQEKWIAAHRELLPIKFVGAIGAVFDFYSGKIKRSPPVFQRMGLEWLPRLIQEPKRLWRRTFISAPVFLVDVLKSAFFEFLRKIRKDHLS